MARVFERLSAYVNRFSGAPVGFAAALLVVAIWALTGPIFGFSDTWQLVINTGTTIVTFLMAFLINGSQNVAQAHLEEQTARIETLEGTLDEHVNTTAKEHARLLAENTELTREIHRLLAERTAGTGAAGRTRRA